MGRASVRDALATYLTSKSAFSNGGDNSIPLLVGVVEHPEKQSLDEAFANIEDTNIDSTTGDGTTATATTVSAHGLQTGMAVTIAGCSVPGYDASSVAITVTGPATFTYPNTTTDASSGGYVSSSFDSGAVIFMFLGKSRRGRMAIGGAHSGTKSSAYTLTLNCYLRSSSDLAEDADVDNDAFLDALIAAIEADRTAGTGSPPASPDGDGSGTIFQWGEGPLGSAIDIEVSPSYPTLLSEGLSATQVYTEVTIAVIELIST
jgi:hypothetical protein